MKSAVFRSCFKSLRWLRCQTQTGLVHRSRFNFSNKDQKELQNKENPCWIQTIRYEDAEGKLKQLYDRVKGPDNNVDNIMLSHSLRPHSLEAHMHSLVFVLNVFF